MGSKCVVQLEAVAPFIQVVIFLVMFHLSANKRIPVSNVQGRFTLFFYYFSIKVFEQLVQDIITHHFNEQAVVYTQILHVC